MVKERIDALELICDLTEERGFGEKSFDGVSDFRTFRGKDFLFNIRLNGLRSDM